MANVDEMNEEVNNEAIETEVNEAINEETALQTITEDNDDSSVNNVLVGVIALGTATVGGIALKKYGPKIKAWAKAKHDQHMERKDAKAVEYCLKRKIQGSRIDEAAANEALKESTPVVEHNVEKPDKKAENNKK